MQAIKATIKNALRKRACRNEANYDAHMKLATATEDRYASDEPEIKTKELPHAHTAMEEVPSQWLG